MTEVRDNPNISSREREGNKFSPNVPKDHVKTMRIFYTLQIREEMSDGDDDEGKSLYFFL